jgi:hypothetical protein
MKDEERREILRNSQVRIDGEFIERTFDIGDPEKPLLMTVRLPGVGLV